MQRFRKLHQFGVEACYFGLTLANRGGKGVCCNAAFNRSNEALEPLRGLFSGGADLALKAGALVDQPPTLSARSQR